MRSSPNFVFHLMMRQTINAYEFERHAGCKTKHPNNHIYFENGKTIYAVVQELKSTPQEMLFDVIQNVTGSAVNQKNFNTWKGELISYSIKDPECLFLKKMVMSMNMFPLTLSCGIFSFQHHIKLQHVNFDASMERMTWLCHLDMSSLRSSSRSVINCCPPS